MRSNNQYSNRFIALAAVLAVFLVGCSGGKEDRSNTAPTVSSSNPAPAAPRTNTNTPSPTVNPTEPFDVGGDNSDTPTAEEVSDGDLAQINSKLDKAISASKGAEDEAKWAKYLGIGLASVLGLAMINRGYRTKKALGDEDGAWKKSFSDGLFLSTYHHDQKVRRDELNQLRDEIKPQIEYGVYQAIQAGSYAAGVNAGAAQVLNRIDNKEELDEQRHEEGVQHREALTERIVSNQTQMYRQNGGDVSELR